jgi:hypothetical protein
VLSQKYTLYHFHSAAATAHENQWGERKMQILKKIEKHETCMQAQERELKPEEVSAKEIETGLRPKNKLSPPRKVGFGNDYN